MRRWFSGAPSTASGDHQDCGQSRAGVHGEDAEALEHMENGLSPKHADIEEWVRRQVCNATQLEAAPRGSTLPVHDLVLLTHVQLLLE